MVWQAKNVNFHMKNRYYHIKIDIFQTKQIFPVSKNSVNAGKEKIFLDTLKNIYFLDIIEKMRGWYDFFS